MWRLHQYYEYLPPLTHEIIGIVERREGADDDEGGVWRTCLVYFHASTDDVLHIHLSCLFITSNLVFFSIFFEQVWLVIGGDWIWMFTSARRAE